MKKIKTSATSAPILFVLSLSTLLTTVPAQLINAESALITTSTKSIESSTYLGFNKYNISTQMGNYNKHDFYADSLPYDENSIDYIKDIFGKSRDLNNDELEKYEIVLDKIFEKTGRSLFDDY